MNDFFTTHSFTPTPSVPLHANFTTLCAAKSWTPNSRAYNRARRRFREAMIAEFNNRYGVDDCDLGSWQRLCAVVLGLGAGEKGEVLVGVPGSITGCKKLLKKTHVNLVDLIDLPYNSSSTDTTPVAVRRFNTLKDLREYTKETGKYFPKNSAKQGGILKALLRDMV